MFCQLLLDTKKMFQDNLKKNTQQSTNGQKIKVTMSNESLHVSGHNDWIRMFLVMMTGFGHSDISAISDIRIPLKKKSETATQKEST